MDNFDTDCRQKAMEVIIKYDGDTSTILKYLAMIENSDKPDRDEKLSKIEIFVKRMYLE